MCVVLGIEFRDTYMKHKLCQLSHVLIRAIHCSFLDSTHSSHLVHHGFHFVVFEMRSYFVVLADLELALKTRLASNSTEIDQLLPPKY